MSTSRVIDAYSERADEYIAAVGSVVDAHPDDRELVLRLARHADGPVIDAGCGPGQWTSLLHERGTDVEGVDLVPAFIERARQRFPGVPFRVGDLNDLRVPDGSVAGILSWYSIIHTEPEDVGAILREFARCIKPGGHIVVGFFDGPGIEAFEHKVVTAYRWPADELHGELEDAGFEVLGTYTRTDPDHRPHGAIFARRSEVLTSRTPFPPRPWP